MWDIFSRMQTLGGTDAYCCWLLLFGFEWSSAVFVSLQYHWQELWMSSLSSRYGVFDYFTHLILCLSQVTLTLPKQHNSLLVEGFYDHSLLQVSICTALVKHGWDTNTMNVPLYLSAFTQLSVKFCSNGCFRFFTWGAGWTKVERNSILFSNHAIVECLLCFVWYLCGFVSISPQCCLLLVACCSSFVVPAAVTKFRLSLFVLMHSVITICFVFSDW